MFLQSPFSSLSRSILKPLALLGIVSLLSAGLVSGNSSSALANGTCGLDGVGTSATPYLVATAEDLAKVGVGGCALSAHYQQTANITLAAPVAPNVSNHTPIGPGDGGSSSRFSGTYDGGNYTIIGLTIVGTDGREGLFRYTDNGSEIKNLRLEQVSISGGSDVGAVVGYSNGDVSNVHVLSGTVQGTEDVGGVIGDADRGQITNSTSAATVSAKDGSNGFYIGGFIGWNLEAVISGSSATGDVSGGNGTGGFVGGINSGSITDSFAHGDVTNVIPNQYGADTGGFAGWIWDATITGSHATGDVTVSGSTGNDHDHVGGFAGHVQGPGTISVSYASGNVVASDSDAVGGFIGRNQHASATISDSFSVGDTNGKGKVGGFAGRNQGTITNSYSVGVVQGSVALSTGGFVGDNDSGSITNSRWDTETSALLTSDGGTGQTTAEMQTLATFDNASWAITTASAFGFPRTVSNFVWGIGTGLNCGYPFLYWQTESVISCGTAPTGGPVAASTPVTPVSNYFIAVGFDKGKAKLKKSMRAFIRKELNSRSGEVRAVCVGTVRGKKWTPKREALALARAASGCDYVTKLNPGLPVELKKRLIAKGKGNPLTVRVRVFY